jgi:hypothetical protein
MNPGQWLQDHLSLRSTDLTDRSPDSLYNGRRADRFLVGSQRRKRKMPQVLRCVHKSISETTGLHSEDRGAGRSIAWPRVLIGPLHVEVIQLCIPRLLIQGFRPLVGAC